jgi:hypothetical protein
LDSEATLLNVLFNKVERDISIASWIFNYNLIKGFSSGSSPFGSDIMSLRNIKLIFDLNGDGFLGMADARAILQTVAGIINEDTIRNWKDEKFRLYFGKDGFFITETSVSNKLEIDGDAEVTKTDLLCVMPGGKTYMANTNLDNPIITAMPIDNVNDALLAAKNPFEIKVKELI